jgi:GT2 family glycosyltransferase
VSQSRLTIGIVTRDRFDALVRCLRSLNTVAHLDPEVLVYDDASSTPVAERLASVDVGINVRVMGVRQSLGMLVGRNRLVREAMAPAVLLLDDDAGLLSAGAIDSALQVLDRDPNVAAIGFAQGDRHGARWADSMQPSTSHVSCYVPAFIGFAHLLRRDVFNALGGYREALGFYGEEKEFCLRLIEAGYRTVYLPDALVMHEPDPGGRSPSRYLRNVTKNDCLNALYNEPLHRLVWVLPGRLYLYFRMRRSWKVHDPWGWAWVLRQLAANAGDVMRERRPVSSQTLALWKRLQHTPQIYRGLEEQRSALERP